MSHRISMHEQKSSLFAALTYMSVFFAVFICVKQYNCTVTKLWVVALHLYITVQFDTEYNMITLIGCESVVGLHTNA